MKKFKLFRVEYGDGADAYVVASSMLEASALVDDVEYVEIIECISDDVKVQEVV